MVKGVATVLEIREIARDVLFVDARLKDPPDLNFRAGQFLSVRIGQVGVRRPYSIASPSSRTDGFSLVIKRVPGGVGSRWFDALRPGDDIHFTGPAGFFTTEPVHLGDVVFGATGTGIAAVLPMLDEILQRPTAIENGRVLLFWGLRDQGEMYLEERLDELGAISGRLEIYLCLSRPAPGWDGTHGRLTQHVLSVLPTLASPIFYLVGNGTMIRELRAELETHGIDRRHRIRYEIFFPQAEP